jgi:hypothetical protein
VIHLLSGLKIAVTVDEVSREINKFGRLHGKEKARQDSEDG